MKEGMFLLKMSQFLKEDLSGNAMAGKTDWPQRHKGKGDKLKIKLMINLQAPWQEQMNGGLRS